mgnify:CR=1 FL=1
MKNRFLIYFLLLSSFSFGQLKPIGTWTEHMPHKTGTAITRNANSIFCGTRSGVFQYNTEDGSISRYTKVNKLNDIVVSEIKYNSFNNVVVVVYDNANIDILKGNNVINIPFIKSKEGLSNKEIFDISFNNEKAYLSFGFGVVELDTDKNEISDTYQFGSDGGEIKINSTAQFGSEIYCATDQGIFTANINSNLLDFNSWSKYNQWENQIIKKVFTFNNMAFAVVSFTGTAKDSLFNISSTIVKNISNISNEEFKGVEVNGDELIYASKNKVETLNENLDVVTTLNRDNNRVVGVSKSSANGMLYLLTDFDPLVENNGTNDVQSIRPNGPFDNSVFDLEAKNGVLWAVPGGIDGAYNGTFNLSKIYNLKEGSWTSYVYFNSNTGLANTWDLSAIAINPLDENDVYFGSFGKGLFRYRGQLPFIKYDQNNSGLEERNDVVWNGWIGAVGIDFDADNNLWITNTYNTRCLKARINGNWIAFDFRSYISSSTAVTDLVITESGLKWMVLPRDNAILVFNDNGTPSNLADDETILLNSETGNGAIPGIVGINITKDKKDQIWVGTTDGIAVFFNPDQVFENGRRDAQRILIDGEENVEVLLASTTINNIAVDGANRKWIATAESGAYLLSEDGTEQTHHFTTENSPLLSNNVTSIAVDDVTGEVYFGTNNGIISYRGTATEGKEDFSDVKVFPNPVRDNYTGPIAISGLIDNSTVKITDVSGNLVNELRSVGGQAIWNGTTFTGERASTGVYLIFNSAEDAEQNLKTNIGKILFVK